MKSQILIFKNIVNRTTIRLLLFAYLVFLILIINYVMINPNGINNTSYAIVLGNYNIYNNGFISMLWLLFQSFLIIYIQLNYLTYEFDNSFEFIILRKPLIIIVFQKIFTISIVNIIFKLLSIGITYIILSKYYVIGFNIMISNIIYIFVLSFVSFVLFVLIRFNNYKWQK